MHLLLLYVDRIAQPLGLRFKDRGSALGVRNVVWETNVSKDVEASDDFGQAVSFPRVQLLAAHVMDVKQDLDAQGEIAVIQQGANMRAQERLQTLANFAGGRPGLVRPS